MVDNLQGAIIAAGRGERLRKSVDDVPKPLVMLGGEPLLFRQARALLDCGASDVIAVVNSETSRLMAERRATIPQGLGLIVRDTANSMESLFTLGERIGPDRHFILTTVDAMIARHEMNRFVSAARAMTGEGWFDGVLGVVRWRGDKRPLFATTSSDGAITALGDGETRTVTAGIYYLPKLIFNFVNEARDAKLDAMRRFLAMLLDKGVRLGAFELEAAIDIDEASDLEAARAAIGEQK